MEITYKENIERLLREDIIEKKRTGRGAFSMRGKGVKHGISGAFRTPSYFMSNKEKKLLNGEVETFNMYETILPYEEFKLKDKEMQKLMLTRWREIYDNMKIRTELGLSNKAFYDLVAELEIPKKTRIERKGLRKVTKTKQAKPQTTAQVTPKKSLLELAEDAIEREDQRQQKIELKKAEKEEILQAVVLNRGMTLNYHDDYNVEELDDIFSKCQLIINGAKHKYKLSLTLTEIKE